MPRHSASGLRRSSYARGGRDQLVLEGTEDDRGRVIRIRFYVALAEVVNKLRFLLQVKGFLKPPIDNNIMIREDNEGAIKMATNLFSSRHMRNVDVKHYIVRDAVDSGIVRIHHVKSGKKHADMLTKALDVNSFEPHTRFLLNTRAGSTTV